MAKPTDALLGESEVEKTLFGLKLKALSGLNPPRKALDAADPYVPVLKRFEGHIRTARRLEFINKKTGVIETEEWPTVGFGDNGPHVIAGTEQTVEESLPHLKQNIIDRLPEIKGAIPGFDSLSEKRKQAIVVGWFRGDIRPGHKTVGLIKEGKFFEASREFLKNDDYITAVDKGKGGLRERMEYVSSGILGKEIPPGVTPPRKPPRIGDIVNE
jgi:hypothetical protein